MTGVLDEMTAKLRACEEKLLNVQDYKKNDFVELCRSAEEAIKVLELEHRTIEERLPTLMEKEQHQAMERVQKMKEVETSTSEIEQKLKQLHAHTGELCTVIEPQTKRLTELQTQIQYLEVLVEVETLSTRAREHSKGNIDALVALADLNTSLATKFGIDASYQLNLRTLIKQRMAFLEADMKSYHTNALDKILQELQWPQFISEVDFKEKSDRLAVFQETFTRLVQIQLSLASVSPAFGDSELSNLWAMDRLLQPLLRRFHFHFEQDNKTNDISKPEWYLTHVLEILRGHARFFETYVVPALSAAQTKAGGAGAMTLFIHGLLQSVRHKLRHTMPLLLLNKSLFCHTIDEVVAFEWALRNEFGYRAPKMPNEKYRHALDEFAVNAKASELWHQVDLENTQNFISSYFQEQNDAWDLILAGNDDQKVTNAAYTIAATFDLLTRRFQILSDATHRYAYVANVVKPWLYQCHVAIERFGRSQHMGQAMYLSTSMHPTRAKFCAAVNSGVFVHKLLHEHDEVKVYVELLPIAKVTLHRPSIVPLKLKQRVAGLSKTVLNPLLETQEAKNVTHALLGQGSLVLPTAALSAAFSVGSSLLRNFQGPTSPKAATKTTEETVAVDEDESVEAEYTLEGSMFENEWTWFQHATRSMEESLVASSFHAVRAQWATYGASSMWTASADIDRIVSEVSPELGYGLTLFSHHLVGSKYFTKTCAEKSLNTTSFDSFWKAVAKELDGYLLSVVLQHKEISPSGRQQLITDVDFLARVLRPYTGRPDAYTA
ncbi:unnamed protein product [Aphanomyces euteiches]